MAPSMPEDKLPAYVYAAASAARMLGLNLWTLPAADRDRVILAALDALPVLPDLSGSSENYFVKISKIYLAHLDKGW